MPLENRFPIPDSLLGELGEYQRILNKFGRSTSTNVSYENPDTLVVTNTAGSSQDNNGEAGLAILLFTEAPSNLQDYIYADTDYTIMKDSIEDNESDILINISDIAINLDNIDILRTGAVVTGTADAIILTSGTASSFDFTIDLNPITFIPTANNTGAVTVNLDGHGAVAISKPDGAGGVIPMEADDFVDGTPITILRRVTGNFFLLSPKGGANDLSKVLAQAYNVGTPGTGSPTLRHTFVGACWIHWLGTMTGSNGDVQLKIDGDDGEKFSGVTNGTVNLTQTGCDIRCETGFEYRCAASPYGISYSEDDGSGDPKKSTPKFNGNDAVGAGYSLLTTIVDSGFVNVIIGSTAFAIKIECDGVVVFDSDIGTNAVRAKWRFNSELKIYAENTGVAEQVVQYEKDN
jgi:hypothetical protein